MTDYKFNKDYINELKKKIINYVSRSNVNVNRITFILSLYTNFIIDEKNKRSIIINNPEIKDGKITPAEVIVGADFFNIVKNEYYIDPEYEDYLTYKLVYYLVKGCAANIKYDGKKPECIIDDPSIEGYRDAMAKCIAEDILDYNIQDSEDKYVFNKKMVRMINAIIGERHCVNSFFRQDDSYGMMIYSLSTDRSLVNKINKLMILIKQLTSTLNNKKAIKCKNVIIKKLINNYKHRLINLVICELYIPYINSVGFDSRRAVRDDILKGFLGVNYTNLKLTDDNKDSYYWASLINNTIPINNKVSEQSIALLKSQIEYENEKDMHNISVMAKNDKTKNNIKEFFVFTEKDKTIIKSMNKKDIVEPHLVEEILSYAYLNDMDKKSVKTIEEGIIKFCMNKHFKCSLKGTPLANKMLVASIIKLAKKNGYTLKVIETNNNKTAEFEVVKTK